MLEMKQLYLIFSVVLIKCYLSSTEIFEVDVNDILNEQFMPISLFLKNDVEVKLNNSRKHFYQGKTEGDFNKALNTMGYHRKKMNEYLCSNFVVDEIIRDIAPPVLPIERRVGIAPNFSNTSIIQIPRRGKSVHQEGLLFDQGSSGYQNWLQKRTTLDDIQQQIKQHNHKNQTNSFDQFKPQTSIPPTTIKRAYNANPEDEFYEEGDITGYAVHKPLQPDFADYSNENNRDTEEDIPPERSANIQKSAIPPHNLVYVTYPQHAYYQNYEHISNLNPYQTHATAADGSYAQTQHQEGHYQNGQDHYDHDHEVHHHQTYAAPSYPVQDFGQGKELGIKDFIDIALTTLAFLSFGMFILQVLMCITMNKTNNNLMMMPMEIDGTEEVEEIRKKRSLEYDRVKEINEISRRVLVSIEAVLYARIDDGQCVQRVICTNNKYAREQSDGRRIWMPVWSLGLSWLSARFVPAKASITSALDNLKAAAIGLGDGSCEHFYPSCNYQKIFVEKEKFRRDASKREDNKFKWSV